MMVWITIFLFIGLFGFGEYNLVVCVCACVCVRACLRACETKVTLVSGAHLICLNFQFLKVMLHERGTMSDR